MVAARAADRGLATGDAFATALELDGPPTRRAVRGAGAGPGGRPGRRRRPADAVPVRLDRRRLGVSRAWSWPRWPSGLAANHQDDVRRRQAAEQPDPGGRGRRARRRGRGAAGRRPRRRRPRRSWPSGWRSWPGSWHGDRPGRGARRRSTPPPGSWPRRCRPTCWPRRRRCGVSSGAWRRRRCRARPPATTPPASSDRRRRPWTNSVPRSRRRWPSGSPRWPPPRRPATPTPPTALAGRGRGPGAGDVAGAAGRPGRSRRRPGRGAASVAARRPPSAR